MPTAFDLRTQQLEAAQGPSTGALARPLEPPSKCMKLFLYFIVGVLLGMQGMACHLRARYPGCIP
jgi:hypothetical protein